MIHLGKQKISFKQVLNGTICHSQILLGLAVSGMYIVVNFQMFLKQQEFFSKKKCLEDVAPLFHSN